MIFFIRIFKILCILIFLLLFYVILMINSRDSYYFCENNFCVTFVHFHKGQNVFIRVYEGRLYSKIQLIYKDYAEYSLETEPYISFDKIENMIVVSNFTLPDKYNGKLNNTKFIQESYGCCGIKYDKNKYRLLFI